MTDHPASVTTDARLQHSIVRLEEIFRRVDQITSVEHDPAVEAEVEELALLVAAHLRWATAPAFPWPSAVNKVAVPVPATPGRRGWFSRLMGDGWVFEREIGLRVLLGASRDPVWVLDGGRLVAPEGGLASPVDLAADPSRTRQIALDLRRVLNDLDAALARESARTPLGQVPRSPGR